MSSPPSAPPPSAPGGLDAGAITGIVIGIIAVIAIVGLAAWWFFFREGAQGIKFDRGSRGILGIAGAASSHDRVGEWSFKSLLYRQTPDYIVNGVTTAAYMGPTTTWRKEGNPLGLSWLAWGIIGTVGVLVIVGISLGIAGAAGAFNGNSTAIM